MRRRHYLAAATAIALAGCSDETSSNDQTDGPDDDVGSADDNGDENGDDGQNGDEQSDVDQIGTQSEDDSDGTEQQADEDEVPSDEELIDGEIETAQVALDDAIAELEDQAGSEVGAIDARADHVSVGPVDDHLSDVRRAIADAQDLDATDDQLATLEKLERTEEAVRTLSGRLDVFGDLANVVDDVLDSVREREFDDAPVGDLERAADDADVAAGEIAERVEKFDAEDLAIEEQVDALQDDTDAAFGIAGAIGPLADAEAVFWAEYELVVGHEFDEASQSALEDASAGYEAAADSVSSSPAFANAADSLGTYSNAMDEAAYRASRVVNRHTYEFYSSVYENAEDLEDALSEAESAGLADPVVAEEFEYDMREYTDPKLEYDPEYWTEDGALFVTGEATNETRYEIEGLVAPAVYDEDGNGGADGAKGIEVSLEPGESWSPNEPWKFGTDEYTRGGLYGYLSWG